MIISFLKVFHHLMFQRWKLFVVADTKKNYNATIQHSNDFFGGWNVKGCGLQYKYLQDLLVEMGFEINVKYEHDGVGIESWYSVYASW